jgi:LacI family transcriptional regulator, gluconate utilization system Gnt-I transcriptional repressor
MPKAKTRGRPIRPRPNNTPSIEDVAVRAGTSIITVSRALRQPDKVRPETRARIVKAVEALGYIPNLAASSLVSRRSGIIAVVVPTLGNSIFTDTLHGLSDGVTAAGRQLLVGDTGYSEAAEHALITALAGRRPDAIAIVGVVRNLRSRALLASLGIPVAETWDMTDDPIDHVVGFSNEAAGRAMTRFLLDKGRRRIAFVGGGDPRSHAREAGYRAALRDAGRSDGTTFFTGESPSSFGDGRRLMHRIAALDPRPDAVFFSTDVLAVGGVIECRQLGIDVPRDIAIAGLGDLEIGRELVPALTTVQIPSYQMGRRAAEILSRRLAGEDLAEKIVDFGVNIVARDST